jgi:hypothetical protein
VFPQTENKDVSITASGGGKTINDAKQNVKNNFYKAFMLVLKYI